MEQIDYRKCLTKNELINLGEKSINLAKQAANSITAEINNRIEKNYLMASYLGKYNRNKIYAGTPMPSKNEDLLLYAIKKNYCNLTNEIYTLILSNVFINKSLVFTDIISSFKITEEKLNLILCYIEKIKDKNIKNIPLNKNEEKVNIWLTNFANKIKAKYYNDAPVYIIVTRFVEIATFNKENFLVENESKIKTR